MLLLPRPTAGVQGPGELWWERSGPGDLPLGWLWEPAWIPQACWWAATLPCAGVCGAVSGRGWMYHRVMSGGLCERETRSGVFMCEVCLRMCVCVCMFVCVCAHRYS